MNWSELSDTSKALIYLGGLIVSGVIGGFVARPVVDDVMDASVTANGNSEQITSLHLQLSELSDRLEALEAIDIGNFVEVGEPIEILGLGSEYLLNHGGADGGVHVNAYPRSQPGISSRTKTWTIKRTD